MLQFFGLCWSQVTTRECRRQLLEAHNVPDEFGPRVVRRMAAPLVSSPKAARNTKVLFPICDAGTDMVEPFRLVEPAVTADVQSKV